MGRRGGQCFPDRWLPYRTRSDDCPGGHSDPGRPGGRWAPVDWSGGRPAHCDRPRHRQRAAVPGRQPHLGRRVVSRPIAAVTSGAPHALGIDSGHAVEVAFGQAHEAGLILGHAVQVAFGHAVEDGFILGHILGFFVPVAGRLSQPAERRSCLRQPG